MNQSFLFATTPSLLMQCSTKRARYRRSRNERGTTGLNDPSGGLLQLVAADQNFGRELEARGKPPDHLERERAHAVEHFRNPREPMYRSRSLRVRPRASMTWSRKSI